MEDQRDVTRRLRRMGNDAPRFLAILLACAVLNVFAPFAAHALENAKFVTAEQIAGVVVEAGTGKPIANAIVAIRFERNNTGHSGPHCFRSMAVQTNAEGRFRFAPWRQENTRANFASGQINAYKAGYAVPWRSVPVTQSRRSIGDVAFSDTIKIPKTEVRVELAPFAGSDDDRVEELWPLVANFTCRWQAEFDDMILLFGIRDEIASAPFANKRFTPRGRTPYALDPTVSEWIDAVIKRSVQK